LAIILVSFVLTIVLVVKILFSAFDSSITGAPPYGESEEQIPVAGSLSWLKDWQRPDGPLKVGIQVGHWKNNELPEELKKLKPSTGSAGGGKNEWEVNLTIAKETAKILEQKGIKVEVLPATVPKSYWADVFIAIHADGSTDRSKSGFKIAAPWRDYSGNAPELVDHLKKSYQEVTSFSNDENITRNMRGYYAFAWWRYDHTIHPMATAAIIETGFLTNYSDRQLLINKPGIPAQGIAQGVFDYLSKKGLLD